MRNDTQLLNLLNLLTLALFVAQSVLRLSNFCLPQPVREVSSGFSVLVQVHESFHRS